MALSSSQIKDMQSWYGTKADGIWGKGSTAAAGGRDAGSAYSLYNSNRGKYNSYTAYMSGSTQSSSAGNGINANTIREMQKWYGTDVDGVWGKNSTAAAGGRSVNDAYTLWSNSRRYYGSYGAYQNRGNGGTQSSSTGSGINANTIKEMQRWYGATDDGIWGKGSTAAAGGKSLNDAYTEWRNTRGYYGSYADYQNARGNSTPSGGSQSGGSGSGYTPSGSGSDAGAGYDYSGDYGYSGGYDYTGPMSYGDYLQRVGGDDYQSAVQKAIEAQVQAATDQYNSQIESAGKDYEENARRAYINKMMSQRNMDQELAANGVYGGMADSQRIASETNYENNMTDLTNQYQSTLADLQQAITSARMAGDAQAAETMANYLSQVQAQYASYLQNERSIQAEIDMFNRQLAAQQAQEARAASYSGGSSGGGGYSGGYSAETAALQQELNAMGANLTVDGIMGPKTRAAYEQLMGGGSSLNVPRDTNLALAKGLSNVARALSGR